ncbi:hypothetical protein [Aliivibrio fischeri]|uniref:Uncharacterized protein n=1 Tax=Aliivibrio fischeri TaxID=668 RepID=A0A510UNG8_ALIFS|nr:hypothetical protein [Aliivibrio fischeri]GEK16197.1 hypothetical protein AFI02nite_42330 [Aliivibrio fischeri]
MTDILERLKDARNKSELFQLKSELLRKESELSKKENELDTRSLNLNEYEKNTACDIEYHSQSYAAFFNTRMEKDKSILTLSVVGIGYLATFSTLGDEKLDGLELIIFILASLSFISSIIFVIQIFKLNGDYIKAILVDGSKASDLETKLKNYDRCVLFCFIFGLIFTIVLGYVASEI